MIDSRCHQAFQRFFVTPVARYIQHSKTSPTTLTLVSLIAGLLATPFIAFGSTFFSLFFLFASGYLDNLDGALARLTGKKTRSGCVIDILSDRVVELGVVFALYGYDPQGRGFLSLLILGSMLLCISSFLLVGVFSKNRGEKGLHYSPGLIERTETFVFFTLCILFPGSFTLLGWIFSALVLLTAGLRLRSFLQEVYYEEL